ncbi:MAG: Fe-S cluster assembly protein SufB, partial [Proteobacteria bacterium]|nr:Fe-S cluster assembly protein SufB [Pseudomonadota bacterium]
MSSPMSSPSENLDLSAEQAPALQQALQRAYQHGFVTDIESDSLPPGLDEDTIRAISRKKKEPEFLLNWRLAALKRWQAMELPDWARLKIAPID